MFAGTYSNKDIKRNNGLRLGLAGVGFNGVKS